MASPSPFDLDSLLNPISEDSPVGSDLRSDYSPTSLYQKIKAARSAARSAERGAVLDEDDGVAGNAEWREVRKLAPEILGQHSKDLEVVSWFIESLARLEGFAGVRFGFQLARELVERYWDGLFPLPDEDGVATKVAPLTGLNGLDGEGTLIVPLARIEITQGQTQGPFATWHFTQAREIEHMDEERRQQRIQAGAVTTEMFQTAAAETSHDFFRDLLEDIELCADEFKLLSAALDERCGHDAPGTSQIRTALETALDTVRFVTRDILPADELEPVEEEGGATSSGEGGGPSAARTGDSQALQSELARTREQALQQLAQVAAFFRRTEPHSPVSYLLEQAVRWSRMPLPELLGELIPDDSARQTFNKLTGIPHADE